MLLFEDDFVVDARCRVESMQDVLISDERIGVVGGAVSRMGISSHRERVWPRMFAPGGTIPVGRTDVHSSRRGVPYVVCDWISNFALFRRQMLIDHPWNERLKVREHADHYHGIRRAGKWLVAHTDASTIGHDVDGNDPPGYREFRDRPDRGLSVAVTEEQQS
jgi:hypothetical protein